jgi:hypothetical protein
MMVLVDGNRKEAPDVNSLFGRPLAGKYGGIITAIFGNGDKMARPVGDCFPFRDGQKQKNPGRFGTTFESDAT